MTLYFSQGIPENTPIYLDGDFSGFTSYRMQLVSMYTNREISADAIYEWTLELELMSSNTRYTYFELDPFAGQGSDIRDEFKSGYYEYVLYGSLFAIDKNTPWDPEEWTSLLTGEVKVKSKTTNNMQTSGQTETVKYTTEPNTAQSYVIYN